MVSALIATYLIFVYVVGRAWRSRWSSTVESFPPLKLKQHFSGLGGGGHGRPRG